MQTLERPSPRHRLTQTRPGNSSAPPESSPDSFLCPEAFTGAPQLSEESGCCTKSFSAFCGSAFQAAQQQREINSVFLCGGQLAARRRVGDKFGQTRMPLKRHMFLCASSHKHSPSSIQGFARQCAPLYELRSGAQHPELFSMREDFFEECQRPRAVRF